MNKRLLVSAFVLAGALALSGRSNAQTNTYDLQVNSGGRGFLVTIQKWDGSSAGDHGTIFRVSKVIARPYDNQPNYTGVSVALSFWGNLGCAGGNVGIASISGVSGLTTLTSSGNDPQSNTDSWTHVGTNAAGTDYATFTKDVLASGDADNVIKTGATNKFLQSEGGRITTASLIASAEVTVTDSNGGTYVGCIDLASSNVPEASSLALLLPGLVPLGLVMRRRARARS